MTVSLDDAALFALDSQDVLGAIERFADQCKEAWDIGLSATDLPEAEGVDSVVVLGMGGSGISGDVVLSILDARLSIPMRVVKSYGPLPEWVTRNTLVYAVSYSGNTEETIAGLEEALGRGARVITISSGGRLEELAGEFGLAHVKIPSGQQPRASLGYLTMPILATMQQMGLAPDMQADVEGAVSALADLADNCHRKTPSEDNPAKDLAQRIHGRVPIIYGGYGVGATVAYRFKCDLNEYGKSPAFFHFLPELDHNEIVGWSQLSELTKQNFVLILLRVPDDHPRVQLRFDLTRDLVAEENFVETVEVGPLDLGAEGTSPLAHALAMIFVTQMAAIYLGLAYGVDPGPVEVIERLKKELSEQ
jgi:glucose/mannose-6-phosphate isomerase